MKLLATLTGILLLLCTQTASTQWLGVPTPLVDEFEHVYFRDAQRGFAVTPKGFIYRSLNGGQTWTQALRPDQLTGFEKFVINDIYFITDNIGFFVGYDFWEANYLILQTVDGGQNWDYTSHEQSINVVGKCNAIDFTNTFTGYVVGDNGQFFKSVNAGLSWSPGIITGAQTADLIDLDFVNEQVGYALAESARLFKTSNAGSTWQNIFLPATFKQIFFFSENVGLGFGNQGLYKTANGGQNWTFISNPNGSSAFTRCFFLDENVGFFKGSDIFKTEDGGLHWYKQELNLGLPPNTSYGLYDLFMLDGQTGWVCGGKVHTNGNLVATLAKTTNGGGMGLDMALSSTQLTCPGDSLVASASWLGAPSSFSWFLDDTLLYTGPGPFTFYNLSSGYHEIAMQASNGANTVEVTRNFSVAGIISFPNQTFTISTQPCQGSPTKVKTSWNNQNNARLLIYEGNTFIDTVEIQTESGGTRFFMLPPVDVPTTFRFEATYACASGILVGQITVTPKLLPNTGFSLTTPKTVFCGEKGSIPITLSGSEAGPYYRFYQDGVEIELKYGNGNAITINSDPLRKDTRFWGLANNGCIAYLPDTLVVYVDKTDARFGINGVNFPVGTPVEVAFQGLEATAFEWSFGQGASPASSTDKVPGTITYTGTLNTQIQLITTGFHGCQDTSVKNLAMYTPQDIGEYWAQDMNQGTNLHGLVHFGHVAVDPEGNVFTNGVSRNQAIIPSRAGTGVTAEKGVGLMKYDKYGVLQWYVHHEGDFINAVDLLADKDGNSLVLYNVYPYQGSAPDVDTLGSTDEKRKKFAIAKATVVAKWDPDGKLIWLSEIKPKCSDSTVSPNDMELDEDGNIYVLATHSKSNLCTNGDVTFWNADSSSLTQITAKHFVAQLSPDGIFQWVRGLTSSTGANVTTALSLTLDAQKNMIVGGNGISTTGFAMLAKFDPLGNLMWQKTPLAVSPTPKYEVRRVVTDASGNIYLNAEFQGAIDFGNVVFAGTAGTNVDDQFVMKVSPQGQILWAVPMVSNFDISATGMELYGEDLFVAATFFKSYQVGAQIMLNVNYLDNTGAVWLQMSAQNGALKKYKALTEVPSVTTTRYNNRGNCIAIDGAGNLHLSGVNAYKAEWADTLFQTPNNTFLAKIKGLDTTVPTQEALQALGLGAMISPNPSQGNSVLQLDLEVGQRISCRLSNMQGQTVMHWDQLEVPAGHADYGLDPVPPGVYFLHISNETGAHAVLKWVVVD